MDCAALPVAADMVAAAAAVSSKSLRCIRVVSIELDAKTMCVATVLFNYVEGKQRVGVIPIWTTLPSAN